MNRVLLCLRDNRYNEAKLKIAIHKCLPVNLGVINFFSDEYDMVIEPSFSKYLLHYVPSECSHTFYNNRSIIRKRKSTPAVVIGEMDKERIGEIIYQHIRDWLSGVTEGRCGQAIDKDVSQFNIYEDVITETG